MRQSGEPALHITEYARQKKAGLIMMATHGYGPLRSPLLGSITAKALHDAACPVWTTAHAGETAINAARPWRLMICVVDDDARDVRSFAFTGAACFVFVVGPVEQVIWHTRLLLGMFPH